jgi:hypothetical protein
MQIGELIYKLGVDVSGIGGSLSKAEAQISSFGNKIGSAFKTQAGQVFSGVAAWDMLKQGAQKAFDILKDGVQGALDDSKKLNETKSIIKALGMSWEDVGAQMEEFGNKMLQLGLDDETANLQTARFAQRLKGDLAGAFEMTKLSADLAASGFGTMQENADRLEKVLSGRGMRAMVEYGIVIKDNATVAEQLAAIHNRVTRTAEDFANSTEGRVQKVKQAYDELKSALGKGVLIAFSDLAKGISDTSGDLVTNQQKMEALAKTAYQLANGIAAIGAGIVLSMKSIPSLSKTFELAFNKIGSTVFGDDDELKKRREELLKDLSGTQDVVNMLMESLDKAASGKGFESSLKAMQDIDAKAKSVSSSTSELTQDELDAAEAAKKMGEEQKKAFEAFQGKLLDVRDSVRDLADDIKNKLTENFKNFKKELSDEVKTGSENLADIVVNAEARMKEINKEIDKEQQRINEQSSSGGSVDYSRINELKDEFAEKRKILDDYSSFQTRLNERLAAQQKTIDDLTLKASSETDVVKKASLEGEIEARQMVLDQTKGLADLDKTVADARKTAQLTEFQQAEENIYKQIDLKTNAFITEVSQMKEKLVIAQEVETSITQFYSEQTAVRQGVIDQFAVSTIAQMQRIGAEAKSAMSALSQLQSLQSRSGLGKAMGGYTVGGEMVHGGEYVIPRWLVSRYSGLVSQLEGARTGGGMVSNKNISAPVTIVANIDGAVDMRTIGSELAFEISKL